MIRQFRDAQPTVELNLYEMTTVQQVEALEGRPHRHGLRPPNFDDDDVVGELVREEAVMVALPANHRLVKHKRSAWPSWRRSRCCSTPPKPRPSYADQVLEMFQSRGLKPLIALESNEVQTAIGLVVAGLGYALVPQSVQNLHREGVLYLPLGTKA